MAGPTKNGWEGRTFQEILQDISSDATAQIGGDFPTTPDSRFGQLASIFANSYQSLWQLGQAITDTQNRDTAEGVYLDYLAELLGLSRLTASGSTGDLVFTGIPFKSLPAFFAVQDNSGRIVLTQDPVDFNKASCNVSTFSVNTILDSTEYLINVQGVDFKYTSSTNTTENDILSGLESALQGSSTATTILSDNTLVVTFNNTSNTMFTTNSGNLSLNSVGVRSSASAVDVGSLIFPENTLTIPKSTSIALISVTNPLEFTEGRLDETDVELRERMKLQESSTGTATVPAIEGSLSEIQGVTSVLLKENYTLITNSEGIPAKTIAPFITGGDEETIAKVLFNTRPASIPTYGSITKIFVDERGIERSESFSRKSDTYAWMRVSYSLDTESDFPLDGEQAMKDAVTSFGEKLPKGVDYDATKFYAPLYTVQGVYINSIEIATTSEPNDTPVYGTSRIPVGETEVLLFDDTRTVFV